VTADERPSIVDRIDALEEELHRHREEIDLLLGVVYAFLTIVCLALIILIVLWSGTWL